MFFKNECGAVYIFNHLEINELCLYESACEFVNSYKLNCKILILQY